MKNRMLKRSHLSEKQCREIIQLFTEDLTATQIANITFISRVTINNYLKLIRTHIAKFCEERNPRYHHLPVIPFVPVYKNNGVNGKEPHYFFGFYRHEGSIYADLLPEIDKNGVHELQRMKLLHDTLPDNALDKYGRYQAIADFDSWRLYRIDTASNLNGRLPVDDISVFWGNTKNRLLKFRGLNKSTLYLHVKESEFRYNFRNEDINEVLLNIINKRPLHFSKSYS